MILQRYLPGLLAAIAGAVLLYVSRTKHAISAAIAATLLGLICMEAEYWVAHGFPWSEIPFFSAAVVLTLTALAFGAIGGAALGIIGLGFLAYVNLRYGAPYLLDYILPVLYASLLARSRPHLRWHGRGVLRVGWTEGLWILVTYVATLWRTTTLDKWRWITGKPW